MDDKNLDDGLLRRRKILRVYLSGLVALAILYLAFRLIYELMHWINKFDDPLLAFLLGAIGLLLLPLLLGLVMEYGFAPLIGRWHSGTALLELQDRLTSGLAEGLQPQVVIINNPDKSVRSFGTLTAVYPATDHHPQLAAVFVPWGPQSRRGKIHIVALEDLEVTNWSFRELQVFLLSYGTLGPDQLDAGPFLESGKSSDQ